MIKWTFKKLFKLIFRLVMLVLILLALFSVLLFEFSLDKSSFIHVSKFSKAMNVVTKVEDVKKSAEDKGIAEAMATGYDNIATNAADKEFYDSAEDVYILTDDNLKLYGKLYKSTSESHIYVISCHGYSMDSTSMVGYVKPFYKMGYNVLTPDARACGESDGKVIGMGWLDRLDVCKWIDYILTLDADAEIVLHGVSMGGATVMMASGEELPSNVKAIIEDCGYTSVWDEYVWEAKSLANIPEFPIVYTSSLTAKLMGGYNFAEASSVEQIKKSKTPILFIHGDQDTFVPYKMLSVLFNSATCEKEMLVVPGAGHAASYITNTELYWDTIKDFVQKYL